MEIEMYPADRLVKFNRTDCAKVDAFINVFDSVAWDVAQPVVAINRACALFALNASHRIDAAQQLDMDVPCIVIDEDLLGDYCWDGISDASDMLAVMSDAGLAGFDAYSYLASHIAMERDA
jgi:hypothetical protein